MKQHLAGAARTVTLGLLATALLAAVGPAAADTDGFFFGLDLLSNRVGAAERTLDADPSSVFVDAVGGGADLFLGWGFSPSFPVRLSISAAQHDTSDPKIEVAYGSVTLDGMFLFRDPEVLRPYLYGGFGGFTLRSRQDALEWETTGPGILLGGGLFYFFGDTFALDFSLRGELVNWKKTRATLHTAAGDVTVETPVEEEGSAAKLLFGASWWL